MLAASTVLAPSLADAATGSTIGTHTSPADAPTTVQVTNTNDTGDGSLRNAIGTVASGGTITFASDVTGTIDLASSLQITQPVTIDGPGEHALTIASTSGDNFYVHGVTGGPVVISNLAVSGGSNDVDASNATLDVSRLLVTDCEGNGINGYNSGMTVRDSSVSGCQNGGIVAVGGSALVVDTTVSANRLGLYANHELVVADSTMTGNTFGVYTYSYTELEILNSTITGNATGIQSGESGVTPQPHTLQADILAGNTVNCVDTAFVDDGYNLIGAATGDTCKTTKQTSSAKSNVASFLGSLRDNGGPAPTVAIAATPNDPAFRAIPATAKWPAGKTKVCSGTDERGVTRTAPCSIGAFEAVPPNRYRGGSQPSHTHQVRLVRQAGHRRFPMLGSGGTGRACLRVHRGARSPQRPRQTPESNRSGHSHRRPAGHHDPDRQHRCHEADHHGRQEQGRQAAEDHLLRQALRHRDVHDPPRQTHAQRRRALHRDRHRQSRQ